MKLDKNAILEFARIDYIDRNKNPYEAVIYGLEVFLSKTNQIIVDQQEYACLMELKEKYEKCLAEGSREAQSPPARA